MPLTTRLLLSAALLSCLLGGCARRGNESAAIATGPGPTAPAAHEIPEAPRASPVPPSATSRPDGTATHEHAHSHEPGAECQDACCREPEHRPAGTAVFAPPPKTTLLRRGDTQRKRVALTFDGSPVPASTSRLVALLRAYGAKATFFVVGEQLEGNRYYVDGIVAEKHLLGNHTMAGRPLAGLSRQGMSEQIKDCDDLLERIVEQLHDPARPQMRLLRPPDGRNDSALMEVAKALGYTVVLWSVDGRAKDNESGEKLAERVCSQIESGSIVRLQDGPEATALALPRILEYLQDEGYECVTVDEMLE